MILIKTLTQIQGIRESGKILHDVIHEAGSQIVEGMTTGELNKIVHHLITKAKATPAFLHYAGFPAAACISVNEEVIHGIPSDKKVIKKGDLISLDVGVNYKGYISDSAYTFTCGEVTPVEKKLLLDTQKALEAGIAAAVEGNRVRDISNAVYSVISNYGVVYEYCGHGVGIEVHEEPSIPNDPTFCGRNPRLRSGMVVAIEPMVNLGVPEVKVLSDGWTVVTRDGKRSAHFEHTLAITDEGPQILT